MGGMPINATWGQDSFRWYTDAGGEGTNPVENTNVDPTTLTTGVQYRLRYVIQETANSNVGETPVFELEYRVDPAGGTSFGSWLPIDSDDTYFTAVSSASVTDGGTTTQQIGSGTFNDGEFSYVDATARAPTNAMASTNGGDEYECEWVLNFAAAAEDANFEFRVTLDTGQTLDAYTRTTQTVVISTTDALLADDVQSLSQVTSPALAEEHVLTVTSVESASQVSSPAITQENALTATSVESASEAGGVASANTYYSDASVSGPTDADAAWSSDANAFDGSTATAATGSFNGSKGSNDLVASGYTGPTSGGAISQVRARVYGVAFTSQNNTLYAEFFDGTTSLGRASNTEPDGSPDWGPYAALSAPSGGWTYAKLDSITCHIYGESDGGGLHKEVYKVELEVSVSGGPTLTEVHSLTATSVESASELTSPGVGQAHTLTSAGAESASDLAAPAINQVHAVLADDAESASEVSSPVFAQENALLATSVESASEVSSPSVSESNALSATSVESASEVAAPVVGQAHALTNAGAESASEVGTPAAGQEHALTATSVESSSELTAPTLEEGSHVLLADDVQSLSEVSSPDITQGHALTANDIDSASELASPTVGQVHALTSTSAESASELTSPSLAESNALLADDVESASEVTSPALAQAHALTVVSVESSSELTAPSVGQLHALAANDAESASELTAPVLTVDGVDALLADSVESLTELTEPTIAQVHVIAANDVESASELTLPTVDAALAVVGGVPMPVFRRRGRR